MLRKMVAALEMKRSRWDGEKESAGEVGEDNERSEDDEILAGSSGWTVVFVW